MKGLANRLFFARHKDSDADWWHSRLADVTNETASQCLTVLLSWGTPDVIAALKTDIDAAIKRLSSRDWARLWSMTSFVSRAAQEHRTAIPENWFQAAGPISPRMTLILIDRVADREAVRRLARNYFIDYAGDDAEILRRAAEIELMGPEHNSIDWDHVPALVELRTSEKHAPTVSNDEATTAKSARGSSKGCTLQLRKPQRTVGSNL